MVLRHRRRFAPKTPIGSFTVTSFNRLLFRSLRLGFLLAPEGLREPLLQARAAVDGYVGLPQQLVLRNFIEEGRIFGAYPPLSGVGARAA